MSNSGVLIPTSVTAMSSDDLFSAAAEARVRLPLAARMRPRTLDEVAGQSRATAVGSPLRRLVEPIAEQGVTPASVVLWGPPGCGKTTIASIVANAPGRRFIELSAVSAGIKDVRAAIDSARHYLGADGSETVLFVDEVHRFSKTQQDALLPAVENRWVTLIAATTENPAFSVVTPLLSRSLVVTLEPLTDDVVSQVLQDALVEERGLRNALTVDAEALSQLVRLASGDARRALTALEASAGAAQDRGSAVIEHSDVERAVDRALAHYDRAGDQHYDVISAFIKSIRGSDVDAALHYLARMVDAGEDPRFIARRLVISAAEDIGMADPQALVIAVAAAEAVAFIGMPEGRIPLAEAVIALATAPKSNAAIVAIDQALADVQAGKGGPVPPHLRDNHGPAIPGAADYIYPHNLPERIAAQQYLPDALLETRYYEPGAIGAEGAIVERLARIRQILDSAPRPPKQP